MKLCFTILLFCFLSVISFGQNAPSDTLVNLSEQQKLIDVSGQKIDSVQSAFYHSSDSLKENYKNKFSKIDSAQQVLRHKADSISALELSLKKFTLLNKVDSLQAGWKKKLDSLSSFSRYTTRVTRALDSLNNHRDSILSKLNSRLQMLKDKTVGKLNDLELPPQLSGKVNDVTSRIRGFQIPAADLNIPGVSGGNGLGIVKLDNLNLQSPVQDLGLDQVKGLTNMQDNVGGLTDVTGKVGDYGKDLQQITKGDLGGLKDLPGAAESKVGELSGVNEIKEQTQVLDEYKEMAGQIQNPDSLKEFAIQEVKRVAINHFAGKEEQLKQAMETIAKYKSKYPSLNSISEVTKRPPNEMKGKPLSERIVPGIGIQIQKKGEDLLADFNPYAGYKFTGRIMAGMGWNQRVAYNVDRGKFNPSARIYGPRAFGEFKLWKGFSPRVEMEAMNTNVPTLTRISTVDLLKREWIWGALAGIKQEYRFFKNVKGTALVMMRLYNPNHKSPYADVVNVRFGFEFPMKRRAGSE